MNKTEDTGNRIQLKLMGIKAKRGGNGDYMTIRGNAAKSKIAMRAKRALPV